MGEVRAEILGTGRAYPQGIMTNADFAALVETSDEWITTRTGIKERHRAGEGEYTSQFAVAAARQAIERARIDPIDIGLVICATVSPDQILPSTACLIQAELGCNKAAAFDLVAACSGFVYGVTMANQMIRSGLTRYALVIGAEVLSRYVDFTDRATCVLFGDGAGAAVLGPTEEDRGILATRIYSDGRFAEQLYSPGGGTRIPPTSETLSEGLHFFKMKGNELFKIAVRSMAEVSREVLEEAGYKPEDVKLFIPHQANQRITDAVANNLKVDSSIVYSNIAFHGNTSSASIPIALDECIEKGKVHEGDLVLLASFGGGVTWGGVLLKW